MHPEGFNTIRFGSRPPLIRMSALADKSLLVRNVVSMLSHWVISRARLYEVIQWSGLLRCRVHCYYLKPGLFSVKYRGIFRGNW